MTRGDLYRVRALRGDPKRVRVVVVVSRNVLVKSDHSDVICAPVHSARLGLNTEVDVGTDEGLKHASAIRCDSLTTVPKAALTDFVGSLGILKLLELRRALRIALDIQ